jgi:hypothetical protein
MNPWKGPGQRRGDRDAVLRYATTGLCEAIVDPPADGSHRPRLADLVRQHVESCSSAKSVFRVPKPAGCFVARA